MQGTTAISRPRPTGPERPSPAGGSAGPDVGQQRLLVSVATYNERGNLQELVSAIQAELPNADLLITDDNSPDGTGELADRISEGDRRVHVVHRAGKLGLGTAILSAMRYAIDNEYDLFLNLDADFSHPPRYLRWLVGGMKDHDVVIGSRYVPGGGSVNWPLSRRLISRSVNLFVRFALGLPVKDASGAFRCYRISLLKRADLSAVRSRGYSFQQEVLYRCHRAEARIGEFPIVFENRKAGASKVSLFESVRSLSMLAWLGVKAAFGR